MAVAQHNHGDVIPVIAPVLDAQAVEVCDLVCLSSGNVVRAADITWNVNTLNTQTNMVTAFLGVSCQRKDANITTVYGNGLPNEIRVATAGVFEFDCASANFALGDLVGAAKDTGNALLSNKVVAVATEALAVGTIVEKATLATRVKVKIRSTLVLNSK